jgi:hypothetical protein
MRWIGLAAATGLLVAALVAAAGGGPGGAPGPDRGQEVRVAAGPSGLEAYTAPLDAGGLGALIDLAAVVGTGDTVVLGFGLESIADPAERAAVLGGVLDHLDRGRTRRGG